MSTQDPLNVVLTVETTLENAKGHIYARYPSSAYRTGAVFDPNIEFDVRYEGEGNFGFFPFRLQTDSVKMKRRNPLRLNDVPRAVQISRPDMVVTLCRNTQNKKTSYLFHIQGNRLDKYYLAVVTPEGKKVTMGRNSLLQKLQEDAELSEYISLVPESQNINLAKHLKKWNLTQKMVKTRE